MNFYLVLSTLCLFSGLQLVEGDCSPSLFQLDSNSLFTLSDDVVDTTNAESRCKSLGGNLLDVKNQTTNETLMNSLTKYTKDLQRIYMYIKNRGKEYTYRDTTGDAPSGWNSPDEEPKYIDLYTSNCGDENQLIVFCKPKRSSGVARNIIKNDTCQGNSNDWTESGLYGYGGNSSSSEFRLVYANEGNFNDGGWCTKLSYKEVDGKTIRHLYEPVYYVFIGAQFNTSSGKWDWSDGSETDFETSGLNVCQQKALHYGENWILTNKPCTEQAYYACQINDLLEPSWKETTCNASVVDVTWKHNFDGLKSNVVNLNDIMITVKVDEKSESQPVPLNKSSVTIYNLQSLTSYNVRVSAKLDGCTDLNIESTLSITTGASPLEPVTTASVWSPYECIVEIPPQPETTTSEKITAYQIIATSPVKETTVMFEVSSEEANQTMRLNIPISDHGFEQRVDLTIASISGDCSARNESVQGYCISPASCNVTTTAVKDSVLILSHDLADVKTAEEKCSMFGGYLVTTTDDKIKKKLEKIMTDTYTRDLTRVWIFYNENNSRFTRYSTNSIQISPWISTGTLGQLEFVDLSNKIFPNVSKIVYFCRNGENKWHVQNDTCSEDISWNTDFTLYEGRNSSWLFKEVYNYVDINTWSSRLLGEDSEFENYTEKGENLHIADLNVFIGARFDVKTEKWIWSDGTEANFDQPTPKLCKQKILHYGKSWQLEDVKCGNYQAFFVCQTKLNVSASVPSCNSTIAQVKWSDSLTQLIKHIGHKIEMKIETTGSIIMNDPTLLSYEDMGGTVTNLSPRTTYHLTATAIFEGCNNFNISSTVNFTTGYGPPGPVKNPQVKQSTDSCFVTVEQDDPSANIERYVVIAISKVTIAEQSFDVSDSLNFTISTSEHGNGNQIILTIYSINCEGQSEPVTVEGVCSSLKIDVPSTKPSSAGAIAGGVVGGLVALLIVALIFLFGRRITKKSGADARNTASQGFTSDPTYENVSSPSNSASLLAAYKSKCLNGGKTIKQEFENIVKQSKSNQRPHAVAQHPSNAQRNRYKNIYPYDHARVVLSNNGNQDYINAAYIPGYTDENKFIATQGPKHSTLDDFWLMTWQQRSNIIIMLTKMREVGKAKCEKYWPDLSKSKIYGSIKVQTFEENTIGGFVQRKFQLNENQEKRVVTQFQYVTWPDHRIPLTTSNMFYLRKMIEEIHDKQHPIIVHCSAGAGRTGTYIAMDFLFDQLDAEGMCDVIRCVLKMRENRTDMVQNWKQYALIYKLIVEHQIFPDSERSTDELQALTEADASKMMTQEFDLLSTTLPTVGAQNKDMFIKVWDDDDQSLNTMNAYHIEGLMEGTSYISAQGPTSQTEAYFWMMALKRHNGLIVCMEGNTDHVTSLVEHETIEMGRTSIRVESSRDHGFAIEKDLSSPGALGGRKFLAFRGWDSTALPREATMLEFLRKLQQLESENTTGNTLVYCSDGCSKSGTLIALMNILERVKTQNKVDVMRTVKDLRDIRPNMVESLIHYRFLYAVLMEYLNSFSTYVNYG